MPWAGDKRRRSVAVGFLSRQPSSSTGAFQPQLSDPKPPGKGRLPPVVAGSVVPRTHNVTIEKILVQPHVLAGHLPPPKIP
jgi:hypothetical protein